jgi:5-methylcytosine-specific restriction protein A
MLRNTLSRIIKEFPIARCASFSKNATASFITDEAKQALQLSLGSDGYAFFCKGSPGQGKWADVPWLAVFNPLVTTSATRGYYVVYLFSALEPVVYLSLNQGATAVQEEFGKRRFDVLRERASFMMNRMKDFAPHYDVEPISLGSTSDLPRGYEAGHVFGKRYVLDAMPPEEVLQSDLRGLVEAYSALVFRGGLDPSLDLSDSTIIQEINIPSLGKDQVVKEVRRYKMHQRIERNSSTAKLVKKHHGYVCQACCFDFESHYGSLGREYIEAHHLQPLYKLEEGVTIKYNIATDFAVLCANCHRMIHHTEDVGDLAAFKQKLRRSFCIGNEHF